MSAEDFLAFVSEAVSPYHAVAACEKRLAAAGFTKLDDRSPWEAAVKPNGKYYLTRNQSAVVAFAVGGKFDPATSGLTIAAAHTDSPCLRVKPVSTLSKAGGIVSVGVETYGGGLWYTWLDRDLGVAGRAIVEKADGSGFESRLVRIARPILKIPSLAIHLNREVNSEGLKLNAENHLAPVLCTAAKAALEGAPAAAASGGGAGSAEPAGTGGALTRHHPLLVKLLASELGVAPEAIKDFDLCLYDTAPAAIGGACNEFIFSARLDNLMMTYTALVSLLASVEAPAAGSKALPLADDPAVRVFASFDHEEVGSDSVPGAGSTFMEDLVKRLVPTPGGQAISARNSILISADMAHAVHPNYSGLHEENHRPVMHGGVVLKCNANQRYATTNVTAFLFRQLAKEAGVPVQNFVVRQDMGCGSTIGPIVATRLGFRTVDIGVPQWSMHSCRETCGVDDVKHAISLLSYAYARFSSLDASIEGGI